MYNTNERDRGVGVDEFSFHSAMRVTFPVQATQKRGGGAGRGGGVQRTHIVPGLRRQYVSVHQRWQHASSLRHPLPFVAGSHRTLCLFDDLCCDDERPAKGRAGEGQGGGISGEIGADTARKLSSLHNIAHRLIIQKLKTMDEATTKTAGPASSGERVRQVPDVDLDAVPARALWSKRHPSGIQRQLVARVDHRPRPVQALAQVGL